MQNEDKVMKAISAAFRQKEDRFAEVKKFLYRPRDCERRLRQIEDKIADKRASIGARGMNLDEYIPSGHDYTGSSVENAILALTDLESRRKKAERACHEARAEVTTMIAQIKSENQQKVLTGRYLDGLSWQEMADVLDTNVRNAQKLHGRALQAVQDLMEKEEAA